MIGSLIRYLETPAVRFQVLTIKERTVILGMMIDEIFKKWRYLA